MKAIPNNHMSDEAIIKDQNFLTETINKISADGPEKFHVLSDFDRTLTKATAPDGSEVSSLVSVLRDEGYLTPDYPAKAKALFTHYHPIEIDPAVPKEEKKSAMKEWWTKHFELLIASRLNRADVERAVLSQRVQLRDGTKEFLDFLKVRQIPLVIMSSSGLGVEAISLYLKNQNCFFENIRIVSNEFVWNSEGRAVGIKQPIIHSLSKEETILKDFSFFSEIEPRQNVLLLGDSPEDVDMVAGFKYENLLKIGFWNKPTPENEPVYREGYDVLIKNDGTMEKINEILGQIFK